MRLERRNYEIYFFKNRNYEIWDSSDLLWASRLLLIQAVTGHSNAGNASLTRPLEPTWRSLAASLKKNLSSACLYSSDVSLKFPPLFAPCRRCICHISDQAERCVEEVTGHLAHHGQWVELFSTAAARLYTESMCSETSPQCTSYCLITLFSQLFER